MNTVKKLLQFVTMLTVIGVLFAAPAPAHAGTTITVNTITGSITSNGTCSLPDAVQAANTDLAVDGCPAGSGADTIAFGLTGSTRILVLVPLVITAPVVIDGTTQSGWAVGAPVVIVDGNNVMNYGFEFTASAGASTLKGIKVMKFLNAQVRIEGGSSANHVTLQGNYLGTSGTAALGGSAGVDINGGKYALVGGPNVADRNVISGNGDNVLIYNSGDFNTIQGNYIGLTNDGTNYLTGTSTGILVSYSTTGANANAIIGNVISGSVSNGIDIGGASDTNTIIRGNYIGTNAAGTAAIGMTTATTYGISVGGAANTTIGGTGYQEGNLISGVQYGIGVHTGSTNTRIYGNRIGTNAAGTSAITNSQAGIMGNNGPVIVGDAGTAGGNLISGNAGTSTAGNGIYLYGAGSAGSSIFGNRIGTNLSGTASIPNNTGIGIFGGGSATIARNVIAYNTSGGVYIDASSGVAVGSSLNSNNCIHDNTSSGVSSDAASQDFRGNWWGAATGPAPGGSGNGAYGVTYTPFLTSPPALCQSGTGLYDDADFGWNYGGAWFTHSVDIANNRSIHVATAPGSYALFSFTAAAGTHFYLTYLTYPGLGTLDVYLDSAAAPLATLNTNAAANAAVYASPALSAGVHYVGIQHAGPAGSMVAFDTIDVGVTKYDVYTGGSWTCTGTCGAVAMTGAYSNTLYWLSQSSYSEYSWSGTRCDLTYVTNPGLGTMAVYVDSVLVGTIDTDAAQGLHVYSTPTYAAGAHTLRVTNASPTAKVIAIDAVAITP